ncbi:H-NS histone family protein [Glaciimonas immobilis]|uniref:DNA-binding protein H-NS n=1 Tax=Glaciimonas immobilis TaxID=728004 RepID=A0A840RVG0_9BURK|nr:H-NS histone family protein [Glaciimonas immobilis]KAF3997453.1 H-NS histone family protein [Glaciimonas immobilis]MBB5200876.1 DNA-binding protein H-NS [Glaciimonas immobilis]
MDLSNLTVAQLRVLQEQVKQSLKDREQEEMTKAREQILAIAQTAGISLKDLLSIPARNKNNVTKAKVAVRYRSPSDASLQWTGRGRQPKWVQEWISSGKSLDALHV